MDTPSTRTCTQSQQTHISTCPQRVATQNTAPPRFPTAMQSLRIRRICSREEDFMKRSQELKANLVARGHKESLIDPQIQRAARIPRAATLQPRPRKTPLNRVPLVTTYHPGLTSLARITKKHLPILHTSQRLKQALPNPPLVAFRRPKNLRDQIPAPPTNTGNIACGNKRCKTCSVITITALSRVMPQGENTKSEHTSLASQGTLISCRKCGA